MIWWIIGLLLYLFQLFTVLVLEYKHPAKAVAWLWISFCIPIIGFVMYYFLAQEYTARRRIRKSWFVDHIIEELDFLHVVRDVQELHNAEMQRQDRLFRLISTLSESPITSCNRTQVLTNGHATYEAIAEAIKGAEQHIHIEFYIIKDDSIGAMFQKLLIDKAQQGVKVRVLADGVGSIELKRRYVKQFEEAGIEFHWFLPVWVSFFKRRLNYRNHRKIVVVDGKIGFVGGINIGDEYVGGSPKNGFWRDTHLQVEGDAVYTLQAVFLHDWAFASQQRLLGREFFPRHICPGKEQVKLVPSGPDTSWDAIQELYFGALSCARERVWIMTPYFIPDTGTQLALKTAGVSGVDVRIIIPHHSDSKLVDWAARSYLEELMQSGVRFFEYYKGFAHAKTMVMDHSLACVGTANMDMRSFFSNFELNAVMFDEAVIDCLAQDFELDFADSKEIDYEQFVKRSRWQRVLEGVSRMLSPLL
ncbi:cardiolipin synthase [Paenibacillus taiwanensis]|uniref:cardiolipin synthase n=1 Tax=Paenibacillus taiwanensis TaxID=401638 RepID=UPI0004168184|nr:cardiolipin synthase [Paenibacillus taiwanensis]